MHDVIIDELSEYRLDGAGDDARPGRELLHLLLGEYGALRLEHVDHLLPLLGGAHALAHRARTSTRCCARARECVREIKGDLQLLEWVDDHGLT